MKKRKQIFYFNLQNNTGADIPVSILAGYQPDTIINATTRYRWDITAASFSNPFFSIQARPASNPVLRSYTGTASSAAALITALNALNIGTFWLITSGPNTYVETNNDNLVYGDLTIGTATSNITWSNTSVDSGILVNANAVSIISSLAPPQNGVVVVNNGDTIDGNYIFGGAGGTFLIQQILKVFPFTVTTILSDSGSSFGALIPPFVIDTNYNYTITMTP